MAKYFQMGMDKHEFYITVSILGVVILILIYYFVFRG